MNPRILIPPALLALCAWSATYAAEAPPANEGILTLVNDPAYNKIDITLTVNFLGTYSDSDTSTFTGDMRAQLAIDPVTGRSPEFTLLGGDIQGSPISLAVSIPFVGSINVISSTLGGTAFTTTQPGLMDPVTGTGDASQHEFIINSGTVSGTALGNPISITFSPEAPTGGPGAGTETVAIVQTGTDATRAYFNVTFDLPVQFDQPIPNDYGIDASLSGSGTFRATGSVSVPLSDYLAWTEQQGIPGAPPSDPAKFGVIDLGLLWALGLGINDDPRPHLPRPDPTAPQGFLLALPASGSAAPLFVESSTSLAPGSWSLVAPSELSLPTNPLPAGAAETITIAPSTLPARYIRIRAEP